MHQWLICNRKWIATKIPWPSFEYQYECLIRYIKKMKRKLCEFIANLIEIRYTTHTSILVNYNYNLTPYRINSWNKIAFTLNYHVFRCHDLFSRTCIKKLPGVQRKKIYNLYLLDHILKSISAPYSVVKELLTNGETVKHFRNLWWRYDACIVSLNCCSISTELL